MYTFLYRTTWKGPSRNQIECYIAIEAYIFFVNQTNNIGTTKRLISAAESASQERYCKHVGKEFEVYGIGL